jgi:nitronate monooxygenase
MKGKAVSIETTLSKKFGLRLPVIQAPMAGGAATPKLVATVSEEGGLGSLPLGYLSPDQATENIRESKKLTGRPFAVNVFIPQKITSMKGEDNIAVMKKKLDGYRQELGIHAPDNIQFSEASIEELIEVAIAEKVSAFSFTFGTPKPESILKLQQEGIFVMGTATTVREGLALEQLGCDAVVGQGYEAGAHRGTFLGSFGSSQIGTIALTRQLTDSLKIPVIAAGGIMDGRGLVAALALGASAVQMGTAFLTCQESGISLLHRDAILSSTEEDTVITPVFTGKPARGIKNRFIEEMTREFSEEDIPSYPLQSYLTQDIRREATKRNMKDFPSFWAGQGTRLSRNTNVKELLDRIEKEAQQAIEELSHKLVDSR